MICFGWWDFVFIALNKSKAQSLTQLLETVWHKIKYKTKETNGRKSWTTNHLHTIVVFSEATIAIDVSTFLEAQNWMGGAERTHTQRLSSEIPQ